MSKKEMIKLIKHLQQDNERLQIVISNIEKIVTELYNENHPQVMGGNRR